MAAPSNPTVEARGMIVTVPEKKRLGDSTMTRFRMVTSDSRKNDDGTWEDVDTSFWTVEAWGKLGDKVADHLENKDYIIVRGKIKVRSFEHEGRQREAVEIKATSIGLDVERA